ncbi:MAG: hypothetical protein IJZ69_04315 [Bacteroidales bacterium]|nr:hypothetical protein [Bacteroidales bacterium]MBQ8809538.1 hypothetical protein [Bacteroidales bacterium]
MKKIILIVLAIIGVLAPCVVQVNINRACEERTTAIVEYIDIDDKAIAALESCEARSRVHINLIAKKIKACFKELVETAMCCGYRGFDSEKPNEKRKTFCFYARQAGGLPNETLFPI